MEMFKIGALEIIKTDPDQNGDILYFITLGSSTFTANEDDDFLSPEMSETEALQRVAGLLSR